MKCSLGISNFLQEISSLSHSIVFLYFFALIAEEGFLSLLFFGTLHSNGYIFPFLLCFSFPFSQLFVRPLQTAILLFCISFSWGWCLFLSPVQCHIPPSIVQFTYKKFNKYKPTYWTYLATTLQSEHIQFKVWNILSTLYTFLWSKTYILQIKNTYPSSLLAHGHLSYWHRRW